jgi:hypothetical protein
MQRPPRQPIAVVAAASPPACGYEFGNQACACGPWRARLTKEDEVANNFNASANSISIYVDVAVTDQMAGDADLAFARTRHVASSTVTLSPGLNTVPDAFWSAWSVAGNAPSFSHVI